MSIFWNTLAEAVDADDFQATLTLALLGLDAEQMATFEAEWADASSALHDVLTLDVVYRLWGGCARSDGAAGVPRGTRRLIQDLRAVSRSGS